MNTRGLLDQLLKSGQELLQNQAGKGASAKPGAGGGLGGLLGGSAGGLGGLLSGAGLFALIKGPALGLLFYLTEFGGWRPA